MIKITQDTVDSMFSIRFGMCGDYTDKKTLEQIVEAVQSNFGVKISNMEAHNFWRWRSNEYDSSFLSTADGEKGHKEIAKWFQKFVDHVMNDDDDDEIYNIYK